MGTEGDCAVLYKQTDENGSCQRLLETGSVITMAGYIVCFRGLDGDTLIT